MKSAGISQRRIDVVIETMLDEGDIVSCDVKVSNQKTKRPGYKLAPIGD